MFQNISKNTEEVFDDDADFVMQSKNEKLIGVLKQNFSIPNIIIYILAFMMSLLGGQSSPVFTSVAPFGYAIILHINITNIHIFSANKETNWARG